MNNTTHNARVLPRCRHLDVLGHGAGGAGGGGAGGEAGGLSEVQVDGEAVVQALLEVPGLASVGGVVELAEQVAAGLASAHQPACRRRKTAVNRGIVRSLEYL